VEILDADGVRRTLISLVGQDMEGAQTSVDYTGNCLVERYGAGGALTLLYFGADGALKWKKSDHHLQGPFVLSPNGKFMLRTAGPSSKFQVFRTNDPETALPNPFAGRAEGAPYHADFAADNSVVVLMNPRTLYRVDPARGTILDSSPLAVPNAESLAGANSEWFNDHAANRERNLFLEFVYGNSDDKLVVFDADFGLQKAIRVKGYLNSATFVDSRDILLNVGDGTGSGKCALYLVRDFGKPKLVKNGVANSVNTLADGPTPSREAAK
jgi:hypothetical protein